MLKAVKTADGRMHTYSDSGFKIKQVETEILYDDAIDVIPLRFSYEETDIPSEYPYVSETATAEDYEDALHDLGVDV